METYAVHEIPLRTANRHLFISNLLSSWVLFTMIKIAGY